jgi:uridine phosphorylase
MTITPSELIINQDGSVYHLHLRPGELARTIVTVGDQNRVEQVSSLFDRVEIKRQHREFVTHTGMLRGKRISVISTGIGPDNIDIVLNEVDALFNIDFETRKVRAKKIRLDIFRIGTSGGLQEAIDVDSFVVSGSALGFDNLIYFYQNWKDISNTKLEGAFNAHLAMELEGIRPYATNASSDLLKLFSSPDFTEGITATHGGFYGPQGRRLRLHLAHPELNERMRSFSYNGSRITNFEMETAALYLLSSLLGHRALSLNVILANRFAGTVSENPRQSVERLIKKTLETILT